MKKFLKVVLYVIVALVIITGVGGYLFIKNFDLNKYKSLASEIVDKQLGRQLAINGNASLGISLVPTIVIEDVELSNASWAPEPQMLKAKKLEVKFALLPLLHKQIVVDNVALIEPQIYLDKAKDGKVNWDFQPAADAPKLNIKTPDNKTLKVSDLLIAPAVAAEPEIKKNDDGSMDILSNLVAKSVSIENGLIQYNDLGSKKITVLQINSIKLAMPSIEDDITGSFNVVYDKNQVQGNFTVGALSTLLNNSSAYPLDLTAKAYNVDLKIKGSIDNALKDPRFAFNTNIYNPAGNFGAPETTLKAYVTGDTKKVNADIQTLNIVNNLITGKISADIQGKVPSIAADLKSDKINLQNFSSNSNFASRFPELSLISEAQALTSVPATAIPYKDLYLANGKVNLTVGTLEVNPDLQIKNLLLVATLNNGVLNVPTFKMNLGDGSLDASAAVHAASQTLQVRLNSKNLTLQSIHPEFKVVSPKDFGVISGGKIDINANLSGSGATYRQLVQNLNGQAVVIVDKAVLQTGALQFMSGNFITQLLNTLKFNPNKSMQMDLNCAVVRADIAKGKAVFPKGIAFNAKQLNLVGDGKINLVNDDLDFSIRPFSGKVVDTNVVQALSSFIKVKGTLSDPRIVLDDKQAVQSLIGVAVTGPAYLGSKLVLDGDSSPCYTALLGTSYQNRFPAPSKVESGTQGVYEDTTKQVKDSLKDLKNTAKDFLNAFKPKGSK